MLFVRFASIPLFAAALLTLGCHAQQPPSGPVATPAAEVGASAPPGTPLSPEMQRRVEVMLRQKANLPPETTVHVGGFTASEFPAYDTVTVTVENEGRTSKPISFLLAHDRKTMMQVTKFDISADPKALVSAEGRPARGGPGGAPVVIVAFDDLECPFCAKMHAQIFPGLTERYGDKVRIVYKDFPLEEIHPWALRAAVDTNCLGTQSNEAYWTAVDYVHAHAGEIGTDPKDAKAEKTLARASDQLDALTRQQGEFRKLDMAKLNACLAKQDASGVEASRKLAESLNLGATPTFFINGDKIEGAVSLGFLYGIIDQSLRLAGVTPPPAYVAPKAEAPVVGASNAGAPVGK